MQVKENYTYRNQARNHKHIEENHLITQNLTVKKVLY